MFFEVKKGKEAECCGGAKKKQWRKGARAVHMAAQMDWTENEERSRKKKKVFF